MDMLDRKALIALLTKQLKWEKDEFGEFDTDVFGIWLNVSADRGVWRWFAYGTGRSPCPEGGTGTLEESKAAAIEFTAEHLLSQANNLGLTLSAA